MTTSPVISSTGDYPAARGMTTSPLLGCGHVTIIKGEYPAARGMTTPPVNPDTYPDARGMTTPPGVPSTGDYPAARGMTTSPLIGRGHTATFGSEVPRYARHDAVARNYIYGRLPRCAGHDDVAPDRPRSCNNHQGRVPRLRGMTPSRFNTQTNHPLIHTNQGVVSMDGAQT